MNDDLKQQIEDFVTKEIDEEILKKLRVELDNYVDKNFEHKIFYKMIGRERIESITLKGKSAQEWVRKNGEQFGWSWDEGKQVGEPWHFRYKF